MTNERKRIIDGLKMTMELFLFDPSTGETCAPDDLNEINRITYDSCKGAIELLSAQPDPPEWAQKVEHHLQNVPHFIVNPVRWALFQAYKEYDEKKVRE